jgi:hypothetical protein
MTKLTSKLLKPKHELLRKKCDAEGSDPFKSLAIA